jgi:hypothetical protein
MAIREGRWDCPGCGHKGNRGGSLTCGGCGTSRPYGVRFYLPSNEPAVTDPEELRQANAGPDWICRLCASSNRALHAECSRCGAHRSRDSLVQPVYDDWDRRPREEPRAAAPPVADPPPAAPFAGFGGASGASTGDSPQSAGAPRPAADPRASGPIRFDTAKLTATRARVPGWLRTFLALLVGLPALVFAGVLIARWEPERMVPGEIVETSWVRQIPVEALVPYEDGGWALPDSAEPIATEQRVQRQDSVVERYEPRVRTRTRSGEPYSAGTEQYVCGSRDMGNGYFEDRYCTRTRYETQVYTEYDTTRVPVYRKVPVYATWYRYRARRWAVVRYADTAGVNTLPVWPVLTLAPGERPTWRHHRHYARVRDIRGEMRQVYLLDADSLRLFHPGERVALGRRYARESYTVFPRDSLKACRRWHQGRARRPPPAELGCSPLPAERLSQ